MEKLNVKALALSLGITWSLCTLFLGWVATFGWGARIVDVMSSLYIGYAPTFIGGIIGGIWGFFDGAIGGLILAWIYNDFVITPKRSSKKKK